MATKLRNAQTKLRDAQTKLRNAQAKLGDAQTKLGDAHDEPEELQTDGLAAPRLPHIALVAPARTGRVIRDPETALKNAETRLLLAWKYRKQLDPALPDDPPFHAHAWSALNVLLGTSGVSTTTAGTGSATPASAQKTVDALLVATTRLRTIVALTTRPGSEPRRDLHFDRPLEATHALISDAHDVIAGAKKWQHAFPALTDEVIANAERALATARKAVRGRRHGSIGATITLVDSADERQLATDVLLDEIDQLRAAAVATLEVKRPKLAAYLTAPLESSHGHATTAADAPAATTTPAAHGAASTPTAT